MLWDVKEDLLADLPSRVLNRLSSRGFGNHLGDVCKIWPHFCSFRIKDRFTKRVSQGGGKSIALVC